MTDDFNDMPKLPIEQSSRKALSIYSMRLVRFLTVMLLSLLPLVVLVFIQLDDWIGFLLVFALVLLLTFVLLLISNRVIEREFFYLVDLFLSIFGIFMYTLQWSYRVLSNMLILMIDLLSASILLVVGILVSIFRSTKKWFSSTRETR